MSNKKNLVIVSILSIIISSVFILFSVLFVYLTDYDPLKNHFLLNITVWFIEFIVAYFLVMGISKLIYNRITYINKWIMYFSLLLTAIIISLIPGGFESVYISTFFGVISFVELVQIVFKKRNIKITNVEDEDESKRQ